MNITERQFYHVNFETTFMFITDIKAESPSNEAQITVRNWPGFIETINTANKSSLNLFLISEMWNLTASGTFDRLSTDWPHNYGKGQLCFGIWKTVILIYTDQLQL